MLQWLQDSAYAEWVRAEWGWAIALTIHSFGVAIVAGLSFIVALRLAGFFRSIPPTSMRLLFPITWVAIFFQIISGLTLWVTKPADYLSDVVFDLKLLTLTIGIIGVGFFQKYFNANAAEWESSGVIPRKAWQYAAVMALIWAIVLVFGRLTAYLGSLY